MEPAAMSAYFWFMFGAATMGGAPEQACRKFSRLSQASINPTMEVLAALFGLYDCRMGAEASDHAKDGALSMEQAHGSR